MYNEKVMELFKHPMNMGELRGANAVGQVGNVACGDIMKIYLKINDQGIIEDAKFKTFGCVAAIASSSMATELIKGKTIEEALHFDNNEVIKALGELPVHKIHCSVLAKEAIEDAINKYLKKKEREAKKAEKARLEEKATTKAKKENAKKLDNSMANLTKKLSKTEEKPAEEEKKEESKQIKKDMSKLNSLVGKINKK